MQRMVGTFRKNCTCMGGAHPGRVKLVNLRISSEDDEVVIVDVVMDPGPTCDRCLRPWVEVKSR